MNLTEALPEVFIRTWPALDPETQVLLALILLCSHQIDALPLVISQKGNNKFVSGYSCLSRLMQIEPKDYGSFFKRTCEDVSLELPTIAAEGNLESLLKVFSKTRFGFAWAESKSNSKIGGFVCLRDLLSLYGRSAISTDLSIGDIASPNIFSLESDTSLKKALDEMISRRIRRVLISDTKMIISDRQIIDHVFSPVTLKDVYATPSALLDGNIGDLESTEPNRLHNEQSVKEAAELMRGDTGCVICESGIVTPWDAIMKPWEQNKLRIEK